MKDEVEKLGYGKVISYLAILNDALYFR